MESDWMGRYREIVAAVVLHGNVVIRTQADVADIGDGILLRHQQWQILEYIVENRDKIFSMNDISYRLNIPQSTFSKTVKLLCEHGLVEKYQAVNNRKNIILRPTDRGRELYTENSEKTRQADLRGLLRGAERRERRGSARRGQSHRDAGQRHAARAAAGDRGRQAGALSAPLPSF